MKEQPIRILIIEDDPELRRVLSTVLEAEGYDVTVAEGGSQAVETAHGATFDLVVADIRMEGMDGLEALETIQSEQPEVRSLVVTGYSTEADSIRAIRLGVSDYLTKPFRLDAFLDAINAIVAKMRLEMERQAERERLRRTLLWASRLVASYSDRHAPGSQRPLLETAELAASTGKALGLSAVACQQVQLATLLASMRVELKGSPEHDSLTPAIPPAITRILDSLEERWDGEGGPEGLQGEQIPTEARVVAAVLATRELSEGEPPSLLEQQDPGRFEPRVLQQLETPVVADENEGQLDRSQCRGLLSLARALEETGNIASAITAYRPVAHDAQVCREKVEALIGLCRLQAPGDAPAVAAEALQLAEQVGPWTEGWAALNAGLAVRQSYPEEAEKWIRRAGRLYSQMGDAKGQARAALALASVSAVKQESLASHAATLLRPENRAVVIDVASWTLPYLLSQGELSEPLQRLAKRTLWEAPRAVRRLLRNGTLTSEPRKRALEILKTMGGEAPQEILRDLSRDVDPKIRAAAGAQLEGREEAAELGALLRIFSMGPFEVYRGEERVREDEWKTQKIKYVLALLASKAGQPLGQEAIIDLFWPADLEKGKQSLYWSTAVLRKILEPVYHDRKKTLLRRQKSLYLNPEMARWHDFEELERMLSQSRELLNGGSQDFGLFRPLLDLYRGPYLEGYYEDWAQPLRTRICTEASAVLLSVAESALAAEKPEEAVEFADRLTELDPLNTEGGLALMKAQLGLKRFAQAVQFYERLERTLSQELDMEPPIPMVEAYQRAKLSL